MSEIWGKCPKSGSNQVEALKKDKFLSEMPDEKLEAAELEVTNLPLDHPDPAAATFIQEVSI